MSSAYVDAGSQSSHNWSSTVNSQLTGFRPVKFSKLLLSLTSTAVLDLGPHDHIFVLSRLLHVLKWCLLFDKRRGLTTTCHPPSTVVTLLALTYLPPTRNDLACLVGSRYIASVRTA
jgi:hypothetical protein